MTAGADPNGEAVAPGGDESGSAAFRACSSSLSRQAFDADHNCPDTSPMPGGAFQSALSLDPVAIWPSDSPFDTSVRRIG